MASHCYVSNRVNHCHVLFKLPEKTEERRCRGNLLVLFEEGVQEGGGKKLKKGISKRE